MVFYGYKLVRRQLKGKEEEEEGKEEGEGIAVEETEGEEEGESKEGFKCFIVF